MDHFRYTFRFKIALIVFVSTIVTILLAWVISERFIERWYVAHTKASLVETYNSCNEFFQSEENIRRLNNGTISSLYGYVENEASASIFVINPFEFGVYSSIKINDRTAADLYEILEANDFTDINNHERKYKIEQNYTEENVPGTNYEGNYFDLVGVLDNGFYIVVRTPANVVSENSKFTEKLFTSVSLMLLLLEVGIVLVVSNIFSKPITEMSRIARRMSNMDFSAKVNVKSHDEIGMLGVSMNNLSEKLETAIRDLKSKNLELENNIREKEEIEEMRSEFLSHVSHELKTPLALIQGYAEGLKSGIADDPEMMNEYCDVITDEATKMNALVMRLISLNQLETGNDLKIEHFNVTDLINQVAQNSSILIKDKNAKFQFDNADEPLMAWADQFMIEEVVTNYLTNAIHYVKDGGLIRVWYTNQEDGSVRVSVYNDGDRIEDKDIDKLFIKFYKSDEARTREYGGSGIGLSIVAAVMKSHNKPYGVYNTDTGVVFYFDLDIKSEY